MPYITYADMKHLIKKKTDGCANNPGNYLTTKVDEHIPCGYSISTIWAFTNIENNHVLYREEHCTSFVNL